MWAHPVGRDLKPHSFHKGFESWIVAQWINYRVNVEIGHPAAALLERLRRPVQRLVDIAQSDVERGELDRGDVIVGAPCLELFEGSMTSR
jgi:hypothetical protein